MCSIKAESGCTRAEITDMGLDPNTNTNMYNKYCNKPKGPASTSASASNTYQSKPGQGSYSSSNYKSGSYGGGSSYQPVFLLPRVHPSPPQGTSRVPAEGPILHPLLVTDQVPTQAQPRTHPPGTNPAPAPTRAVPDPAPARTRAVPDIPQGTHHTVPTEDHPATSLHTRGTDEALF